MVIVHIKVNMFCYEGYQSMLTAFMSEIAKGKGVSPTAGPGLVNIQQNENGIR